MLRSLLIYLSTAPWARKLVTRWSFAWQAAHRFVAGETLAEAVDTVRAMNQKGIFTTLDLLGESTTAAEHAQKAADGICTLIDEIVRTGVKSNASLKLSQLGMNIDEELCVQNLRQVLMHAKEAGLFVRIDMEDASTVDTTLRIYNRMRSEYGLDNTGLVIQSYLYRSEADLRKLEEGGARIRLCKGAYKEAPELAYPEKKDVDANYDRLSEILLDGALAHAAPPSTPDGHSPAIAAIAGHDPRRIEHAKQYAQRIGLPQQAVEFQMLYGIRRDLQDQLASEGYPVRVYVPYGTEWYPYYMRRLAERPANVWFFISNFFRK